MRQVLIDELLGKVELMGTCHDRLIVFVKCCIRAEKETVATDNRLIVRIPYNQLLIGIFHHVILIQIHLIARGAAGFAEGQLPKPSDFGDHIGRIVPGDDVKLVVSFVRILQFFGFGEFCF